MKQSSKKIEYMKKAGVMLGTVMDELMNALKPGVTELEIDRLAEKRIIELGGEPGFKRVEGYHHTICISTNEVVVHGIPTGRVLQAGDVVGVDCGVFYKGYHTDMAHTIKLTDKTSKKTEVDRFLELGEKALWAGIRNAKPGNRVGHISQAIQDIVEGDGGYGIVRNLVGHGVGKDLHEEPEIPGYLEGSIDKTPPLKAGMTIAVEIIYNMGDPEVVLEGEDDWTIVSEDGSTSGLFERTILISDDGPHLITRRKSDPEI